jgi:23S rRNA pseudouridine1911/1915/1917 synthase
LDRDTSGLMVFARSHIAEQNLIQQFKAHSIERAYQAVACGEVRAQKIDSIIVRDRGDGIRGSAEGDDSGQQAITHVRPIKKLGAYSLVECRLETGRTHQIRIHLSESGHVICGEKVYTKIAKGGSVDGSGAPRLALHAYKLTFVHPTTGRKLTFTSELPRDLELLVKRLKDTKTT